jgi:H+/gluconate symporter-like permease
MSAYPKMGRGQNMADNGIIKFVVAIAIGLFVAAVIVPPALQQIATSNMTGVSTSVTTIFTILLPILAVVAIAIAFLPTGVKSRIGM